MDNIYVGTEAMTKNQNKTQESPGEMNNEIGTLVQKNQRTAHHWKSGTVVIVGNSIVHGLIEPKLGNWVLSKFDPSLVQWLIT